MSIAAALNQLVEGQSLSKASMRDVMAQVMTGDATAAQIGALLVALRMKGESIDEITGAAEVMRELATPVVVEVPGLIDLVGTGGDGANLFNVSTAASFVAAAAGAAVAKHGNRSVSSSSGSSDVLTALGVCLELTPEQIAECVTSVGVGFLFAPAHHSAMKHAIGPRRELAMRTLFNVLGPLTNPAFVQRQVLGVYDAALCEPLAMALRELGSVHALVLHSDDGLDEISIAAPTRGFELKDDAVKPIEIMPAAFGHHHDTLEGLQVSTASESADLIRSALAGAVGPRMHEARSIIILNAGAGIYVSGRVTTLNEGIVAAEQAVASGAALEKLEAFVALTRTLGGIPAEDSDK
ncbi:MAG: anthranilate phosphoribosyltransferase [Luminiphilus sp.]